VRRNGSTFQIHLLVCPARRCGHNERNKIVGNRSPFTLGCQSVSFVSAVVRRARHKIRCLPWNLAPAAGRSQGSLILWPAQAFDHPPEIWFGDQIKLEPHLCLPSHIQKFLQRLEFLNDVRRTVQRWRRHKHSHNYSILFER